MRQLCISEECARTFGFDYRAWDDIALMNVDDDAAEHISSNWYNNDNKYKLMPVFNSVRWECLVLQEILGDEAAALWAMRG